MVLLQECRGQDLEESNVAGARQPLVLEVEHTAVVFSTTSVSEPLPRQEALTQVAIHDMIQSLERGLLHL